MMFLMWQLVCIVRHLEAIISDHTLDRCAEIVVADARTGAMSDLDPQVWQVATSIVV